ncbi:hypothetical protein PUR32_01005, partial [Streptomyces sp. BE133]|nr:hypothetical protein [Streptomyces sp. BE133]
EPARHLTGQVGSTVAVVELDGAPHALTVGYGGSVRVWDLTTGEQTRHLTGHTGPARSVAVAELNGRPHALTGGPDGAVGVWDLTTGEQTTHLTGHIFGI